MSVHSPFCTLKTTILQKMISVFDILSWSLAFLYQQDGHTSGQHMRCKKRSIQSPQISHHLHTSDKTRRQNGNTSFTMICGFVKATMYSEILNTIISMIWGTVKATIFSAVLHTSFFMICGTVTASICSANLDTLLFHSCLRNQAHHTNKLFQNLRHRHIKDQFTIRSERGARGE